MRFNSSVLRHSVALLATVAGFVLSVQLSDRGMLFTPEAPGAMASSGSTPADYDLQALTVLSRVLLQMKDNYVQPDRIDPDRMFAHALDRVQNNVAEVVAIFDRDLDDDPTSVTVRVGAEERIFDLSEMESLWEMSFKLREVFRFVGENLDDDEIDLRDIEYAAINGMLSTLDPHTVLLTPDVFAEMQTANQGAFGGLGISIGIRDGKLTIISPMRDTPAWRAGFRAGDVIVQINGESTVNMPLDDAVSRLRGEEGTEVTVEIMRQGWTEPHSYTLRREIIEIDSVEAHGLGDGIGYIAVSNFQERTQDEFDTALRGLRDELGEVRGLVLDLRNNPGGLLQRAISISDTFLYAGTIVTTVGIGARLREENAANRAGTEPNYPIVVLINPGSASASEIVAGALKNHGRALVVGDRSFGKGSVQVLYDFPDGSALKLTVAEYLTPGDVSIQGVGIVPDIQLFGAVVSEEYIDLYPSTNGFVREGDLEESLHSERTSGSDERPSLTLRYYEEPEEIDPDAIDDPDEFEIDFQIDLARRILLEAEPEADREGLLTASRSVVDEARATQLLAIQERLRGRGVDWAPGETVIQPVTVSVTTNRPDDRVEAGESIDVTVEVRNDGSRTLHQVRAESESHYRLLDDREWVIGRLAPGESRSWTQTIAVPQEDPSRAEQVRFSVASDEVDLGTTASLMVRVDGRQRPRFGLSYVLDDNEGGNGDGMLQLGETVTMRTSVFNVGQGDADQTSIIVRNRSDRALYLIEGRAEADGIEVGAHYDTEFVFRLDEAPASGVVEFDVEIYDQVFREYLREMIDVPLADAVEVQVREGFVDVPAGVAIRAGASEEAPVVARAGTASALAFDRFAGGLYRVTWDGGTGWVPEREVTLRVGAAATPPALERHVQLQPPSIAMTVPPTETTEATITLAGDIRDDSSVRDWYVIVQNLVEPRRTRSLKRAYDFVGAQEAAVSTPIELRPGMNRITVVARDETRAVSTQEIFVYRHDG